MKTVLLCGVRKHVNARLRDGFMVLNGNLSLKNKQSAMKMGIRANGNLVSIFKNKPLNGIPFARERTVLNQLVLLLSFTVNQPGKLFVGVELGVPGFGKVSYPDQSLLADWMLGCSDAWMPGCLDDSWMLGCLAARMRGCSDAWLTGYLDARMLGYLDDWMLELATRMLGCVADWAWIPGCRCWMPGCLADWMRGCLADWMLGCPGA